MRTLTLTLGLLAAARLAQAQLSFATTPVAVVGYDEGEDFRAIAVADFNGDGRDDAATVTWCGARCDNYGSLFLARPNGSLQGSARFFTYLNPLDIVALDLNDDGRPDLLTFHVFSSSALAYLNQGNGVFAAPTSFPLQGSTGSGIPSQVLDFDGDGRPDLLTAVGNGTVIKLNRGGTAGWVNASASPLTPYAYSLAAADFNQDGRPDLLVGTTSNSTTATVYLNNGQGTAFTPAASPVYTLPSSASVSNLLVADVDRDGKVDVVAGTSAGPTLYRGLGDGTFSGPQATGLSTTARPTLLADLDGDGRPDLVTWQSNALAVYRNAGNGTFEASPYTLSRADLGRLALGDANGDGRRDVFMGVTRSSASVLLNTTPLAATPAAAPAGWALSPNPAHDAVQVLGLPAGPVAVQVYDATGRLVRQASAATVPIAGLAPGLYLLRATAVGATRTLRLQVE